MSLQNFDYEQFKAGFREACEQRDIDPEAGATSYQVALIKADQAKAQGWRSSSNWWKWKSAAWRDQGHTQSTTEWQALDNIFTEAYTFELNIFIRRALRPARREPSPPPEARLRFCENCGKEMPSHSPSGRKLFGKICSEICKSALRRARARNVG